MRTLLLIRHEPGPASQASQTGLVAEAAVFGDGTCVLHWLTDPGGTEFYPSEKAMRSVREASGRSGFTESLEEPGPDAGLHGVPDAEVLYAAGRLTQRYGGVLDGQQMVLVRRYLREMADRARELGEPDPAAGTSLAELTRTSRYDLTRPAQGGDSSGAG